MSGTYVCPDCKEIVSKSFVHHCPVPRVRDDVEDAAWRCPECDKVFSTENELKQHFRIGHDEDEDNIDRAKDRQIADLQQTIKLGEERIEWLQTQNAEIKADRYELAQGVKKQQQTIEKLEGWVAQLKEILFTKDTRISFLEGYVARVTKLEPKEPEHLVQVPASLLKTPVEQGYSAKLVTDNYAGSNYHWWNIGVEKFNG